MHFFTTENNWQLSLSRRPDHIQYGPFALERMLVKELDSAQGHGHGTVCILLVILEVEEVLA